VIQLILFAGWVGLIYLCLSPEMGVRLGAWLRNDQGKKNDD